MDKNEQERYSSPEVEVVEIKVKQIICQSSTPEQYQDGSWTW